MIFLYPVVILLLAVTLIALGGPMWLAGALLGSGVVVLIRFAFYWRYER